MEVVRRHVVALAIMVVAAGATGSVFLFARPHGVVGRSALPPPPPYTPPYTRVSFSAHDVRRAFRSEGIELVSHGTTTLGTNLSTPDSSLEVDAFGSPDALVRAGFHDVLLLGRKYVPIPSLCSAGVADAERWRGNVRAVVSCQGSIRGANRLLARAASALTRL